MHQAQTQYQVRFEWGLAGARAVVADADVAIVVDTLTPDAAHGTEIVAALADGGPAHFSGTVLAGTLRNRSAVARWALDAQTAKGDRYVIAVIAAGETWPDGTARFAVEDLLAAGAIIDALGDLGIDYCSPEAAAAAAAYTGLRNATKHLIGASGSGRALSALGRRAELDLAIIVDAETSLGESEPPA